MYICIYIYVFLLADISSTNMPACVFNVRGFIVSLSTMLESSSCPGFRFGLCSACKVSRLIPMAQYIKEYTKCTKKFRNDRERKNYLTKQLGLTLQTDPKKDILCVPVEQDTLMLSGVRKQAERVKRESHDSKEEAKASFKKASEGLQASTNTKARGNWEHSW